MKDETPAPPDCIVPLLALGATVPALLGWVVTLSGFAEGTSYMVRSMVAVLRPCPWQMGSQLPHRSRQRESLKRARRPRRTPVANVAQARDAVQPVPLVIPHLDARLERAKMAGKMELEYETFFTGLREAAKKVAASLTGTDEAKKETPLPVLIISVMIVRKACLQ